MSDCNSTIDSSVIDQYSAKVFCPGNVLPHHWYHQITDSAGNPDCTAIMILAEIVALYRLKGKDKNHSKASNSSPEPYFKDGWICEIFNRVLCGSF